MNISAYEFGKVQIQGRTYQADVLIFPKRVREGWWRRQGHRVDIADLDEIIAERPHTLIVGTGLYSQLAVPDAVRRYLRSHGIEIEQHSTPEAIRRFNELETEQSGVAAALHLTC